MINPEQRAQLEQLTRAELRARIAAGPQSLEWRRAAEEWLDEQERGPDRVLTAEANSLAREANSNARKALVRARGVVR